MAEFNILDLRGVACPMNFVKAKLALDKLQAGSVLELMLDEGEPLANVIASMTTEGHQVNQPKALPDGAFTLQVIKAASPSIDKKSKV